MARASGIADFARFILAEKWDGLQGERWFRAAEHIKGVRKMVDELKRARRIACLAVVAPQGADVIKYGSWKTRKLLKDYKANVAADVFPRTAQVIYDACGGSGVVVACVVFGWSWLQPSSPCGLKPDCRGGVRR